MEKFRNIVQKSKTQKAPIWQDEVQISIAACSGYTKYLWLVKDPVDLR